MADSFVLYKLPNQKEIYLIESKPKESFNIEFLQSLKDEHFVLAPFQIDSKTAAFAFPADEKQIISDKELIQLDLSFSNKLQKGIEQSASKLYQSKIVILSCKIKNGTYQKVVLSRVSKMNREKKKLQQIFSELCKKHETAFVYLLQLPNGQIWCGATPETLANYEDGKFSTMAMAGTQSLDNRNPEKVLWEQKELDEQKWVQDNIEEKLKSSQLSYTKSDTYTSQAGPLVHLRTDFESQCDSKKATQLLLNLHPTPAVCGTPTEEARNEILNIEEHNRLYYSGFLGLYTPQKFNVFVNLRCMLVDSKHFYLFVGGGLTKDSDPKLEWEETENKARTLLEILI